MNAKLLDGKTGLFLVITMSPEDAKAFLGSDGREADALEQFRAKLKSALEEGAGVTPGDKQ